MNWANPTQAIIDEWLRENLERETRSKEIKAIYEAMADKDRTFGCKYLVADRDWDTYIVRETDGECVDLTYWDEYQVEYGNDMTETRRLIEVIWHPVMLGDVISYLREPFDTFIEWQPVGKNWEVDSYFKNMNNLLIKWENVRSSIDEQSKDCIDFIYSLIRNDIEKMTTEC